MLICVDGTGSGFLLHTRNRAANYAVEMMGSFVGMIYYGSRLPNRKYYQGPDSLGTGPNMVEPGLLCAQITEFWRQGDHQVFMAGYSRGAAIVINTAAFLTYLDCRMPDGQYAQVEAMFLFDAVDRSWDLHKTQSIPPNVKYCYHAMRDDRAHSRGSFSHCGTTMQGANTFLVKRNFYTTHGGMGGVPWGETGFPKLNQDIQAEMRHMITPNAQAARSRVLLGSCIHEKFPDGTTNVTVDQEKAGSKAVHDWMWPFLYKHKVL